MLLLLAKLLFVYSFFDDNNEADNRDDACFKITDKLMEEYDPDLKQYYLDNPSLNFLDFLRQVSQDAFEFCSEKIQGFEAFIIAGEGDFSLDMFGHLSKMDYDIYTSNDQFRPSSDVAQRREKSAQRKSQRKFKEMLRKREL